MEQWKTSTTELKKAAGIMYPREEGLCKVSEEGSLWDILHAINQQINSKYRYNSGGRLNTFKFTSSVKSTRKSKE